MPRNIVLIGFMGTGKSSIARILAQKLGREACSTDDIIEKRDGRKIADIFSGSGEAYFRRLEHDIVKEISGRSNLIIDCGGGVVLNPENVSLLKGSGVLVQLTSQPTEILRRIRLQPKRPLLDVPDPLSKIIELLNQRRPYYQQADLTIDTTDGDLARAAGEIIRHYSL